MKKIRCIASIVLVGIVVVGAAGIAQAITLNFDFQPPGETPEVGYTHVDETVAYSAALGYGLDPTAVSGGYSRFRGTGNTTDRRVRGFVSTNGGGFMVDLVNGDYFVTVVAGDPDFATAERLEIEGVTYGLLHGGGATVTPAGANVAKLVTDGFGAFNQVPFDPSENAAFGKVFVGPGEYLMVSQQLITVSDGQLNVVSNGFSGGGFSLNYIDIQSVPEPPTLVLGVISSGACWVLRRRTSKLTHFKR